VSKQSDVEAIEADNNVAAAAATDDDDDNEVLLPNVIAPSCEKPRMLPASVYPRHTAAAPQPGGDTETPAVQFGTRKRSALFTIPTVYLILLITKVNSAFHPSRVGKLATGQSSWD